MSAEFLSSIADIVVALAAAFAAIAAWRGLDTWKNESKWKEDRALAQRALKEIYHYKNTLNWARRNYFLSGETNFEDGRELDLDIDSPEYHNRLKRLYEERWLLVDRHREPLQGILLDAEVNWGPRFPECWAKIFSIEQELFRAIDFHLKTLPSYHGSFRSNYGDDETRRHYNAIVFGELDSGDEASFSSRLNASVAEAEHYLKGYLKGGRK